MFEDDDIIWDILRKYISTPTEVREAILAWIYTVAREKERGETWEKLNDAYRHFHREMLGVDKEKMKRIYKLE